MAIKKLDKISCSLNLGLIYNFSYNYDPKDGVKISIFFLNESGQYNTDGILSAVNKNVIIIGSAVFNLYAVEFEYASTAKQKVLKVNFIDDTFILNNYYIALVNRGCGTPYVKTLGTTLDPRDLNTQIAQALDPDAQRIRNFTQFLDLEYYFNDFINLLRGIFSVNVLSSFDGTLRKAFTGTYREVLDNWCSYYSLAYFFENGVLNIVNPTTLSISLPSAPADALDYNFKESITNTYDTTAFMYFNQEGGEVSLSGNPDKNLNITYVDLFPVGYEFGLDQQTVDLNQVVAAMYGQKFWFLYNFFKGTASTECGWNPVTQLAPGIVDVLSQSQAFAGGVIEVKEDYLESRFQYYKEYGQKIAGRYYLSNDRNGDLFYDQQFKWYDNTNVHYTEILDTTPSINVDFLTAPATDSLDLAGIKQIEGTQINQFYQGINYFGQRMIYIDSPNIDYVGTFVLTDDQVNYVNLLYQNYVTDGKLGSAYLDYSDNTAQNARFIIYDQIDIDQSILSFADLVEADSLIKLFKPRYTTFSVQGIAPANVTSTQSNSNDPVTITSAGPTIVGDVGTIKAIKDSNLVIYYQKYSKCISQSSLGQPAFLRKFIAKEISVDVPVIFQPVFQSKNIYQLNRDLTYVNAYFNSSLLANLSKSYNIPEQTVSYSLNYLDPNIPTSFISNGLTNITIEVSDNGLKATYSYSNSILEVPVSEAVIDEIERSIKNTYIRKYNPKDIISS